MQSKEKYQEYYYVSRGNLLSIEFLNQNKLKSDDVLFLNWLTLVTRSAENRLLRRPADPKEQKESYYYFEDIIDNTKAEKREIILIVDESHKNAATTLAKDIIDYINPKIILKVSATPEHEPSFSDVKNNRAGFVEVSRQEVISEGLIKEKIVVQTDEDLQKFSGRDLDEILLDLGIEKRDALKKEFQSISKIVNPLMLIQLPNDDSKLLELGQKSKEEVVLTYLAKRGIKENEIALWFDGKSKNMEFITHNDSEVNFMLFKQAAGTGWDCPRAHVLVMFREINSPTFYIQTIGRILRMPEPHKKDDYTNNSNLRTAFLYTNYKRNEVAIPDQSPTNKPFTQFAKRKPNISNIELKSAFISHIDYGDLSNSTKFISSFIQSMNKYFGITTDDIFEKGIKKLKNSGIDLKPVVTNEIIVNAEYSDFDTINFDFRNKGQDHSYEMSTLDVEKTFNFWCYQILVEQTDKEAKVSNFSRSWATMKSAIRLWFKQFFFDNSPYYYKIFINDIDKKAASKIRPAITQALKDYRPILNEILIKKAKAQEEIETSVFTIKEEYLFTDDYIEITQNLCVLDKFLLFKNYSGRDNEIHFMNFIESKADKIEWWFKNGDSGKDYFAVKYFNTATKEHALFYPDWIIKFTDGKIGIFDTKSGRTATDTEGRAEALAVKLKDLNQAENKFVGGIIIFENGIWYYNYSEKYEYQKGKLNNDWKKLAELF
ncbi:MAG: DEAD/DEAH box helicase family protein [Bacteroidia bacterium]|nr:DEAD/DEAH box helicase family protein [Bacteroidia bacterium]